EGDTVGVLQALNKRDGLFTDWDEWIVQALGAQCGVALQRQLLLNEYEEKQRIQRDLSVARTIQQGLLPKESPKLDGFDIHGWNRPAEETGGDFYDFQPLPDGRWAITVADVTGHGIGPALIVAECRAFLRATLPLSPDLEQGVTQANQLLSLDLPDDRFVTAFVGLLAPEKNELLYTSAGHGPLLWYCAAEDRFEELPTHGLPLGVAPDLPYDESLLIKFAPGDILLLFTDGFFEWENSSDEAFGTERIYEEVRKNRDGSAKEIVDAVYQRLQDFAGDTPQLDDLTAVLVKKT
ncbi:MAG: SpoIIE family protein phosphatase, partial [Planctomycetales bacterium]